MVPLECVYSKDCTILYKAIEDASNRTDWEALIKFLDTGYWTGSRLLDNASITQQAKTWVIHRQAMTRVKHCDPDMSFVVLQRHLPLHLAIDCGSPLSVVGRLIDLYPQAVHITDDKGMLPIHLALRRKELDDTFRYLLMLFAQSIDVENEEDVSALIYLSPQDMSQSQGIKEDSIFEELRLLVKDLTAIEGRHGLNGGKVRAIRIPKEHSRKGRSEIRVIDVSSLTAIDSASEITGPFEDLQSDSSTVAMNPVIAIASDSANCERFELVYSSALRWLGGAIGSSLCQQHSFSELNRVGEGKTRSPCAQYVGAPTDKRHPPIEEVIPKKSSASNNQRHMETHSGKKVQCGCASGRSFNGELVAQHPPCVASPQHCQFESFRSFESDDSCSLVTEDSTQFTAPSKGASSFLKYRKHKRKRTKWPKLAGRAGRLLRK